MQALITLLVLYAIAFCAIFLVQVGRPARYPDREVARFLSVNAVSDLTTLTVALLIVLGLAHHGVAGYLFAGALVVQGGFYTYRARIGRMMARGKLPKARRAMRIKVDPEVIRITLALTAGIQALTAILTGTDAISPTALVWVVGVGALLQTAAASYSQGLQTNPPAGMVTEEHAKDVETAETPTAPVPAYNTGGPVPSTGSYAKGVAYVEPYDPPSDAA